jgi:hypothetical protein
MSNDGLPQQAVLAEVSWEPSVSSADIGTTANNGVATLAGYVEGFVEKRAAEISNIRPRIPASRLRKPSHHDAEPKPRRLADEQAEAA